MRFLRFLSLALLLLLTAPVFSADMSPYQQGLNAAVAGDYVLAIDRFTDAIRAKPQDWAANFYRGLAYDHQGEYEKAIVDYGEAILIDPKKAEAFNEIAWLLATCPKPELRDGKKAVKFANKAIELSEGKVSGVIDTMAAAYAELGDFVKAVQYQKQYLETPKLSEKLISEAKQRLVLYEAHKPYHVEK